jgi:hypothetical protein
MNLFLRWVEAVVKEIPKAVMLVLEGMILRNVLLSGSRDLRIMLQLSTPCVDIVVG